MIALWMPAATRARRPAGARRAAERDLRSRHPARHGMVLAPSGVTAALIGSFETSRLLRSLLYGVSSTDVVAFGSVNAVLLSVALLASSAPARRAMAVDPITALRAE